MDQRPKYMSQTMKLLEENTALNLHDLGLGKNFLGKSLSNKRKNRYIKIKSFYASNDSIKKVKRQLKE